MAYRQAMQADTAEFRRRSCVAVTSHLDAFHNSVRKAHIINMLINAVISPDGYFEIKLGTKKLCEIS
jgi:hypothetical protein